MKNFTRRQFVAALGPLATAMLWESGPNLILHNANIITINPAQPSAEAVAILGDRIVAIGNTAEMLKLGKLFTKKINMGGKTITPGFIDAHSHPASAGRSHLRNVDCDLRSIKAIKDAIYQRAQNTSPGEWVLGFKYDDTKTSEGRFITCKDLDEAAPDHPVHIRHRGGHTSYVNSKALKAMGYGLHTPDPAGGKIGRDASSGELTGRLLETATRPLDRLISQHYTRAENQAAVKLISEMMAKTGVTSVTDAYGSPEYLKAYQDAFSAGELYTRIYSMIGYWSIDEMLAAGIRTGFGDKWVKVGGMKLTADGSISERTARLSQPYVGRPDDFGIIVMDEEQLYEHAIKAHKSDWQIGIHANGDVGINMALNVFERLQREYRRTDPRFRLEHCTVVNEQLVKRIKQLHAIPNPFSTLCLFSW